MHYKLSTYVDKTKNKGSFVLEAKGTMVEEGIFNVSEDFTKAILEAVDKGLRACRGILTHEDFLGISVQNKKVYGWLNSCKEDLEYASSLVDLYNTLDDVDCVYKFLFEKDSYAKVHLQTEKPCKVQGTVASELFKGM